MILFVNIVDCIMTNVCLAMHRASRIVKIKEKQDVVDLYRNKRLYGDDS